MNRHPGLDLVERARALAPLIVREADEIERTRRLTPAVTEALIENGLYRALLPKSFGGIEASLAERVAARLKEKAGVSRERIAFTATHTHTAPMIRDVAPTILHLLGVPTPADMDGRALIEVLEGEAASPMEIGAAAGAVEEIDAETYTEEDKVVINERLRALGYID